MKICKRCGRISDNNTFYCPDCGGDLTKPMTDAEISEYQKNNPVKNDDVMESDELARRITGASIGMKAMLFHRGED